MCMHFKRYSELSFKINTLRETFENRRQLCDDPDGDVSEIGLRTTTNTLKKHTRRCVWWSLVRLLRYGCWNCTGLWLAFAHARAEALTNEVSRKFGVGVYKLIFRLQESTWRSAATLPAAQRTVQRSDGAQANALGFTVLEIALVGVNPGARLICAARRAGSESVGNRR